jgi:hypothetical protein
VCVCVCLCVCVCVCVCVCEREREREKSKNKKILKERTEDNVQSRIFIYASKYMNFNDSFCYFSFFYFFISSKYFEINRLH